jgi:hypothetical protein
LPWWNAALCHILQLAINDLQKEPSLEVIRALSNTVPLPERPWTKEVQDPSENFENLLEQLQNLAGGRRFLLHLDEINFLPFRFPLNSLDEDQSDEQGESNSKTLEKLKLVQVVLPLHFLPNQTKQVTLSQLLA